MVNGNVEGSGLCRQECFHEPSPHQHSSENYRRRTIKSQRKIMETLWIYLKRSVTLTLPEQVLFSFSFLNGVDPT